MEAGDVKPWTPLTSRDIKAAWSPYYVASESVAPRRDPLELAFIVSGIAFIWALIALLVAGVYYQFTWKPRAYVPVTYERTVGPTRSGYAGTRTLIYHDEKTSKRYVIEQKLDGTPTETTSVTDGRPPVGF